MTPLTLGSDVNTGTIVNTEVAVVEMISSCQGIDTEYSSTQIVLDQDHIFYQLHCTVECLFFKQTCQPSKDAS